jgi:hypothetical protein
MRNPERWRNIAAAWFFAGPFLVLAAFALPPALAGDGLRGTLFCLGAMGIVFGGFGALDYYRTLRAKRRLARGEGLLARWRIDAEYWREFLELDRQRNAEAGRRPNEFSPREQVPASGVEILVGEEAIEIDGSVHRLPRHGTPQILRREFDESRVRPSVIEFELVHGDAGTGDEPGHTCLRFPVPAGAQQEARRIVDHYGQPGGRSFFHGPGDGSDPEDLTRCWQCGFETHRLVSACPKCGATMQSRRWSRRFGAVLAVLGLGLTAMMVVVVRVLLPTLMRAIEQPGSPGFTGTPMQAVMVLAILGAVLVFGLTSTSYGLFQLFTGRRALWPVKVLLGIFGGLYVVGLLIDWIF